MIRPAEMKLALAVQGLRLDAAIRSHPDVVGRENGHPRAIELVLPGEMSVGVRLDDVRAERSPFVLRAAGGGYVVGHEDAPIGETIEVRPVPPPRFYARRTSRGTPMARVATVHGSHLVVHPSTTCGFSVRGAPCRFCVEGARTPPDRDAVPVTDVLEVVRAAFDEGVCEFVYFNTGAFDPEDGGIAFLSPYIEAVRKHFDTLVAAQVHPPREDRWIDRTYAMGVDALSYNLELFDAQLLMRHCVGRARYVGRDRYLAALAHAASVFPSGTVWTDLVLGLEPPESTQAGIDALVAMGVVPVAAFPGGEHPGLDPAVLAPVLAHLYRAARARGINMGWIRDLSLGITPLEARWFAGEEARVAVAVQGLTRWRLGARAARGLARLRRRLRVRRVSESFDSAHL